MEILRRFLQHVLPTGFMKIRYYGFMDPNCSVPFENISTLIQMAYSFSRRYLTTPKALPRPQSVPSAAAPSDTSFPAFPVFLPKSLWTVLK